MRKLCLSNGLRLLIDKIPYAKSVSIGVMVHVGTKHETKETNGIAHFTEHLLFKNQLNFSNMYGNTYIETLGGKMNAFTGKELTCFHVQILSEHLKEAIRTLKDMIFSFSISDADFDKEKQVVIQEIYRYQDNTLERVKIESLMQALGPCSYAFDILGTVSNIKSFTIDEVYNFYKKFYTPSNTVVSISGNIEENALIELIEMLESIPKGVIQKQTLSPVTFKGGFNYIHTADYQSHICFVFPGVSSKTPMRGYYAYFILNHLLGGGRNSRLNQTLREEKGLVYSVYSQTIIFEEIGVLRVIASTSEDNLKKVYDTIISIIKDIKETGFTLDELNRCKTAIKSELVFSNENIMQRMFFFGQEELLGIYKSFNIDEILKCVDDITIWEVENVIKNTFGGLHSLTISTKNPESFINYCKERDDQFPIL
ncbi:M16 family metallopeptidase [Parageobacillus toebii]|uniref:Peptidase M16 N-terminal domain-containing protein n=1 Tax=Parageobacillus toebii TaxID=153151 RepID=A0A150MQ96_9BACL|nr:pitrilysin family protein [Parageobacillus toebii]KYD26637.1 hypothetical protein B4110_3778 [Parageobacillus toebii]